MNRVAKHLEAKKYFGGHTVSTAVIAVVLLVLTTGCLPPLRRAKPGPVLPESFDGVTSEDNSAMMGWNEFFKDPQLKALIQQALVGNQELNMLAQEVRASRNEILARRGSYLPFINLGAGAGLAKPSFFTPEGAAEEQLFDADGGSFPDPLPDFLVASNLSWQLDIWRKLRNAQDAATLRFLGTRSGWSYVVTKLVAEVAENYYKLMALDNQLATLNYVIELQQKSLKYAKAIKEAGRGSALAVQRFEAIIRKNESRRSLIQQEIIVAENRINFVLGRYPQPVERTPVDFLNLKLPELSVGVPAEILRNRYDVVKAEQYLAAAGLSVKVARANFYPSLNLVAGVGWRAFNPQYLFMTPESLIYHVAGELVSPLINRKAIKAEYLTANAMQLRAVYYYQKTIINAVIEVVNRLNKVNNYRKSIVLKKQQLAILQKAIDTALTLFEQDRVKYIDVLLVQRAFLASKFELIDVKQEQLTAVINTYQALGGGGAMRNFSWPPITPTPDYPTDHIFQHWDDWFVSRASWDSWNWWSHDFWD